MTQISLDVELADETTTLLQNCLQAFDDKLEQVNGALSDATAAWSGGSRERFLASWNEWQTEHRQTITDLHRLEQGLRLVAARMREASERFNMAG
ncbi:MAG: WXG100 family type VII secretion target [Chloroflexales bacterium]